jgi:hypothetical protein
MTPELETRLCANFPATFRALARRTHWEIPDVLSADFTNTPLIQTFGIETGDGWYGIISEFATNAETLCAATGSCVARIKQKYATLRIDMSKCEQGFDHLISHAEDESEQTCEYCGAPGTLRENLSYLSIRCDPCNDPAKRMISGIENMELVLTYAIRPKTAEEARAWREIVARKFGGR